MSSPVDLPDAAEDAPWRSYAGQFAAYLMCTGRITTSCWARAFAEVPRHLLLGNDAEVSEPAGDDLAEAYSPFAADTMSGRAWVLSLLDRGMGLPRTLVVGADPYLAALLCSGLGDRQVVVSDCDPQRTEAIGNAMRDQGWFPEIVPDGPGSATAEHGPFDAVLVDPETGPLSPYCLAQLADGGRIVLGPIEQPGQPRSAVLLDRNLAGRVRAHHVEDALATVRADQLWVAFLHRYPGLRSELRARHIPDEDGLCTGCAADGHRAAAPCMTQLITNIADSPSGTPQI